MASREGWCGALKEGIHHVNQVLVQGWRGENICVCVCVCVCGDMQLCNLEFWKVKFILVECWLEQDQQAVCNRKKLAVSLGVGL